MLAKTIHLHTVDLDAWPQPAAAALVSEEERARAARFRRAVHGARWLAARAALRDALGGHAGCAPRALRFAHGEHGKPALASPDVPLHFNVSHSGAIALIAVTTLAPIGVDVELEKPLSDWRAVAARFFSEAERAQLAAMTAAGRQHGFYRCWTRKEAIIKATGAGLSADLTAFDISLGAPRVIADRSPGGRRRHWQLHHLAPADGYTGAIAIDTPLRLEITHYSATGPTGHHVG